MTFTSCHHLEKLLHMSLVGVARFSLRPTRLIGNCVDETTFGYAVVGAIISSCVESVGKRCDENTTYYQ